jgi:hypothetical protein
MGSNSPRLPPPEWVQWPENGDDGPSANDVPKPG